MKRVDGTVIIPGPETLILFGVQVKILSAIFGVGGVLLGHLMAPVAAQPLGWRRQSAVIAAGVLTAIAITIATGQRPLVVFGWSIGIGFAGITIFHAWAARAVDAVRSLGGTSLGGASLGGAASGGAGPDEVTERLSTREERP